MDLTFSELKTRVGDTTADRSASWMEMCGRWVNLHYQQIARMADWKELLSIDSASIASAGGQTGDCLAVPWSEVEKIYAVSNRGDDLYLLRDTLVNREARFVDVTDQAGTASGWSVYGEWPVILQPASSSYVYVQGSNAGDTSQTVRIRGWRDSAYASGTIKLPLDEEVTLNGTTIQGSTNTYDWITHISVSADLNGNALIYHGTSQSNATTQGVVGVMAANHRQSRYTIIRFNRTVSTSDTFTYLYKRRVADMLDDTDIPEIAGIANVIIHGASSDGLRRRQRFKEADDQLRLYQAALGEVLRSDDQSKSPRVIPQATYRELL